MNLTVKTVIAKAVALLGALRSCAFPAQAAEPLKIAFVYVDPVGDSGWTYQHDLGRRAPEKRKAAIAAGQLHPFAGPLKDNAGVVRTAAGVTPDRNPADVD